jgi:II/X family phage/plasmid replication protein
MLDWLSLYCPLESLPDPLAAVEYRKSRPHVVRINPLSGDVQALVLDDGGEVMIEGSIDWSSPVYESIRSDSHHVTVRVSGDRVSVFGSPARSMGFPNNVFGSSDIVACARAHIAVAAQSLPFVLPDVAAWYLTRADITRNYWLGGQTEVNQALVYLRQAEGGRLKVNNKYAETVYWNEKSDLNANKAYSKGHHIQYQLKKNQAQIEAWQIPLVNGLLRLENSRRGKWFRRLRESGRDWKTLTVDELNSLHFEAFSKIIGTSQIEVSEMDSILDSLKSVINPKTNKSISESQALSAYRTWGLVKMIGVEEAKASMAPRTWTHHKGLLFAAGLSWADFAAGNVVPFRRKVITLGEPVESWEGVLKLVNKVA